MQSVCAVLGFTYLPTENTHARTERKRERKEGERLDMSTAKITACYINFILCFQKYFSLEISLRCSGICLLFQNTVCQVPNPRESERGTHPTVYDAWLSKKPLKDPADGDILLGVPE